MFHLQEFVLLNYFSNTAVSLSPLGSRVHTWIPFKSRNHFSDDSAAALFEPLSLVLSELLHPR